MRAEAQSLVAEAQLTNITRQKFKEAYDLHTAAVIERAEKQLILATQARRLINMLDDTPIVPGEERAGFEDSERAKEVLNDAEHALKGWNHSIDPIHFSSEGKMGANAMPDSSESVEQPSRETMTAARHKMGEREPMGERESMTSTQQSVEDRERAQEEGREAAVEPPFATKEETEMAHPA